MAVPVSMFSSLARAEFAKGKAEAENKPMPAEYSQFVTNLPTKTKTDTYFFMNQIPRLRKFEGYSAATRLTNKDYTVSNEEYRIGPISVRQIDLDDDQTGGYMTSIQGLIPRAQKDIGHIMLKHLADGTTGTGFDGSVFMASSHTIGTGSNVMTFDGTSNDAASHRIVAMITDNSSVKPIIFQDRQPIGNLDTDADTPEARKKKEYEYWSDCRFGKGYGFWWDAINMVITDTPTVPECYDIVEDIINRFRTFVLPKGREMDDPLYIHEQWKPSPANFVLACNLQLAQILERALKIAQYTTSGGNVDNVYQNIATVVPTSAL